MKSNLQNTKIFLLLLLSIFCNFNVSSYAEDKCSTRVLKKVCDMCEERALNKLSTDSQSSPPEVSGQVNCPTTSLACLQSDSYFPLLRENYTVSIMTTNESDLLYKLNISKDINTPQYFNYKVRYANFQTTLEKATGYLSYNLVNFNLPLQFNSNIYSYNCIGLINNVSIISGTCTTIAENDSGELQPYGSTFIAIPNFNPLQ